MQCLRSGAVQASWAIESRPSINGPGTCGMDHPFRVAAFSRGAVALRQRNILGCPMVSEVDRWLAEAVQPAARAVYGADVVEIRSGAYACRGRNGQRGARLSEHSFGNALDVFGFRLADGREVTVKSGWRGAAEEQEFLREVFVGACQRFKTVLGPGADPFHYDHVHIDLARHDPKGLRTVCKPVIKHEPLPGEGRIDRPLLSYRPAAQVTAVAATGAATPAPPGLIPRAAAPAPQPPAPVYAAYPQRAAPALSPRPSNAGPASAPLRAAGPPIDLSPQGPRPPGRPSGPPRAGSAEPADDPFVEDD